MESVGEPARSDLDMPDDAVVLRSGVSWPDLAAHLADPDHVGRVSYLDGEMEIVSPGSRHEGVTHILRALIDRYTYDRGIRTRGTGSWTQTAQVRAAGAEPDASYVFGSRALGHRCDLAIEVITTSGSVRKLEIYRRLQVPEVWFWVRDELEVYTLEPGGYRRILRSRFLPDLAPGLVTRILASCEILNDALDLMLRELPAP